MFSVKEAADILRVSERTVRRYLKTGQLKCKRLGGSTIRITQEQLDNFTTPLSLSHGSNGGEK